MSGLEQQGTGTVFTNCSIIDGLGNPPLRNAFVRLQGERIAAVGSMSDLGLESGADHRIDLRGKTVLPGLMDMHVHLGQVVAEAHGAELIAKLEPAHSATLRALRDACSAVGAGITFVRAVGQAHFIDVAIRDAIDAGLYTGPRILPSGHAIIATGGHGHNLPGCFEADGSDQVRKAVRLQLRHGAQAIKLIITGGIGTPGEEVDTPQLSAEEIAAGVEIAHWAGKRVAVHAGNPTSIAAAVRAGVDSVEHGYRIDDATAHLMAERGTYLVPTLIVTQDPEYTQDENRPVWWRGKIKRAAEEHLASFQRAMNAGVKIVLGSDAPGIARYAIRELETLVEAGMSPVDAIRAATSTAAELADRPDLGAVQPGRLADLVIVNGDPSERISEIRKISLVLKGGEVLIDNRNQMPSVCGPVRISQLRSTRR